MDKTLKTGGTSILLGSEYYKKYFPIKDGKILKITKKLKSHDETLNLHLIRKIKDYEKYYTIPDEIEKELNMYTPFMASIQKLLKKDDQDLIKGEGLFQVMYVNYAGNVDLLDSLNELENGNVSIWNSKKRFYMMVNHLLDGMSFLHNNKIAHLDIKPENIMINFQSDLDIKFTIIDFGFCSVEPFSDYIENTKGTVGYFPKHFDNILYIQGGLPKITANDMKPLESGNIPMKEDWKQVYKVDSYCLGRLFSLTYYHIKKKYPNNSLSNCLFKTKPDEMRFKVEDTIKLLTLDDVFQRKTINEVLHIIYN